MNSKVLGAMFLVAGTVIGAGMLVMPFSSAEVGFGATIFELVVYFLFMLIPALAIAEICQFAPAGITVSGLMRKEFGVWGFAASNALLYAFLYSLISAYLAGISGILADVLGVPETYRSLFLVVVTIPLGLIVTTAARLADVINRVFFYVMLVAFVLMVVLGLGQVKVINLASVPVSSTAFLKSLPIYFLAFGFHVVIPPLVNYLGRDARLLKITFVGGLTIPLVIFVLWNLVVHGIASQDQLIEFKNSSKEIDIANLIKGSAAEAPAVLPPATRLFSIAALLTSFIGVGLALVATLKESFSHTIGAKANLSEDGHEQVQTKLTWWSSLLLAFTPPVLAVLFVPQAFQFFLGLAAIIVTVQSICMPLACAISHRKRNPELYTKDVYRFILPNWALAFFLVLFLLIALASML